MSRIYEILIYAGWTWSAVVALVLFLTLRRRQEARGFEVMERHEK